MNYAFDHWLRKHKGIAFEELDQKSEEEKMAAWKEYREWKNERRQEYNRQLHPQWYQ